MSAEEMQQSSLVNDGAPNRITKRRGRPPKKCNLQKNKQVFISTNEKLDPNEVNMICENNLKEIQNISFTSEINLKIDQPSKGNMEAESNSESTLTKINDHGDVDTNANETHESNQLEIPVAWDLILFNPFNYIKT